MLSATHSLAGVLLSGLLSKENSPAHDEQQQSNDPSTMDWFDDVMRGAFGRDRTMSGMSKDGGSENCVDQKSETSNSQQMVQEFTPQN